MFTVMLHNCGTGILPLGDVGYSRKKPFTYNKYDAACNVAKDHTDKHKVMCCVHTETGEIVKRFTPAAIAQN